MRLTSVVLSAAALLIADCDPVRAVECGDTVTASVTLDHDLVDCPGVGLFVGASDVTIDLNGHTLDGDEGQENAIETVSDQSGLTVKGPGVIRGFNNGIEVGGAKLKVLGVTFRDLADAALNVGPCAGSVVAGNVFMDVGQALDFGAGGGKVLVKGNVVARVRAGMVVGDAAGATIVDNLIADVAQSSGILVGGANAVVKGNRVARTADFGVQLAQVTNGKVVANTVTSAGTDGIAIGETTTTRIERNVVTGAVDAGIRILDDLSDGNRVRRNLVVGGPGRACSCPLAPNRPPSKATSSRATRSTASASSKRGTFSRRTAPTGTVPRESSPSPGRSTAAGTWRAATVPRSATASSVRDAGLKDRPGPAVE